MGGNGSSTSDSVDRVGGSEASEADEAGPLLEAFPVRVDQLYDAATSCEETAEEVMRALNDGGEGQGIISVSSLDECRGHSFGLVPLEFEGIRNHSFADTLSVL